MAIASLLTVTPTAAQAPSLPERQTPAQSPASFAQQTALPDVADLARLVHFDDLRALRAFFERVDVSSVAAGLDRPSSSTPLTMESILGRLPEDWAAPFAFVQGGISYAPYAGSVRGSRGTLEAGSGNAIDQALLLQSLLEARGVSTRLVRGRLQWPEAARLAVGTSSPPAPSADDPWPRWLESAADHWWVQAQREGTWVDLDPSFLDTEVGQAVGSSPAPVDRVPDELNTTLHVELRRGELTVAEATLPGSAVVGQVIALSFTARSEEAVTLWRDGEAAAVRFAEMLADVAGHLGWVASTTGDAGESPRPSAFQRILLDPQAGPWVARLEVPGRTLEAGPFERADLDSFYVRTTVGAPLVPDHVLEAPWGGGREGRLSIVVGAGRVSDARLAAEAEPLYRAINRLAALEQEARGAMAPPAAYHDASDRLAAAARAGWQTFAGAAPGVLGWAVLQGVDRVSEGSPAGRVVRQGLRLAAVRWRPAEDADTGSMEIRLSDPVTIGLLQGAASAASLRAANGVLQSAVLSQVLNRVAERAPETAFDVTLRAIGTGRPISVYRDLQSVPESWPATVRAEVAVGLRAGYAVLVPEAFDVDAVGWWHIGIFDGETLGWVPGVQTALHGRVDMDAPRVGDDLEALLASLPALHRALRWLADVPGSGAMALAAVPAAACASASVAAEVMATSVPPEWPRPDVPALCGLR